MALGYDIGVTFGKSENDNLENHLATMYSLRSLVQNTKRASNPSLLENLCRMSKNPTRGRR